MMRKRSRVESAGRSGAGRLLRLSMVPLLALAAVGVAFALWGETLTVNGNVETGTVDAGWTLAICSDIDPRATGEVAIVEADPASGDIPGLDDISFEVVGAYPGYRANCVLQYTYTGSVPVRVESIRFDPANLDNCVVTQSTTTGSLEASCDQLSVDWVDGLCQQLHQGDVLASNLLVAVEDLAEPNTFYNFGLEVQLNQYNESACPND